MRISALFLGVSVLLSGCMQAQDTSTKALDAAGNETSATWNKVRDDLDLGKPSAKPARPPQTRYCYQTYEDILCYASPLAGQEDRLLAYQNKQGTGYTIEPKPQPVDKSSATPVAVTKQPATPTKTDNPDSQLKEIMYDPSELEPKKLLPDKEQE